MNRVLASLLLGSILVACSTDRGSIGERANRAVADLGFPPARQGVRVHSQSLSELVTLVSQATGMTFSSSDPNVNEQLTSTRAELGAPVDVDADRLYPWFESLLVQHGFVMSAALDSDPPLATIASAESAATQVILPLEVRPDEIELLSRHPALFVRTTLTLPHVDVRVLGSILRPLTQEPLGSVIPVWPGESVILEGRAQWVSNVAGVLQRADSASAAVSNPVDRVSILQREATRAARSAR